MNNNKVYEDITTVELSKHVTDTHDMQIDSNQNQITVHHDHGKQLYEIHKLAQTVIGAYDILAFKVEYNKKGEFVKAKPTVIGKALDNLKHALADYDTRYGSCNEYISCVLQTMREYGFNSFYDFNIPFAKQNKKQATYIDEFIQALRNRLNNDYLQMKVDNRQKNARKNFISGRNYVDELFNYYARLNVVRIEFGYKYQSNGVPVPIEEAQKDIQALRAQIKKHPAFEHCVGHLGKMEVGYDKGYHFSFIFLYDGSKVNKDSYRCDLIGKLWCDEINPELGTYHNCNRNKAEYKAFNGIGMVHYYDLKKRENLVKYVIGYATKSSQMVMVKPRKGDRVFYRGVIPKHVREQNAGRPRKQVRLGTNQLVDINAKTGEIYG